MTDLFPCPGYPRLQVSPGGCIKRQAIAAKQETLRHVRGSRVWFETQGVDFSKCADCEKGKEVMQMTGPAIPGSVT